MTNLSFYNTLTRNLDVFTPIDAGRVRMYTCGPTVYNYAHIGNLRCYTFEDLLRRTLKYFGYEVFHVMNLTDVDDKTIRSSREKGVPLRDYTRPFIDAFFEDLATLNIERAEHYPAATDHVPEMIALIETLIEKGYAYQSDDRSVYFSISKFPHYGCLCRLDLSGLRPGARVAQDEYEKEHIGDFALWKAWDEKDGDVYWESPWGRGRPGWHIECSAMSMKYLGSTFDIHCGGMDNIFPHHDDEIAQSEAATGHKFVHYWLHNAHLIVEGKKMSKSAGNFFTLRDLLARGYSGREIRYELISTHYRQSLNFTLAGLDAAKAALSRLDEFRARLQEHAGGAIAGTRPVWAADADAGFRSSLGDDLNISGAMAAVFEMLRSGNRALDAGALDAAGAAAALAVWDDFDRVLGFLQPVEEAIPPGVLALVTARTDARTARNWAESDRLRAEIEAAGYTVKDTPQGVKVRRKA
ncbi:MAG TPA: cysteine--tRNA ligase [Kiritimatiellia bacterium]|nr:cysteine--tRNA ligase [Kiritimatiellia bacterium]HMO97950.1 cysteine--tRNA ligase [Kiritimatiellia bacterium]HMP95301.1 cysteine--tRNA ligase [Kiritimatiellia bacterium]